MSLAQKWVGGLVIAMVATAVLLPGRQTVPALNALTSFTTGNEKTVIEG
jgi:hypothetical protein